MIWHHASNRVNIHFVENANAKAPIGAKGTIYRTIPAKENGRSKIAYERQKLDEEREPVAK